MWLQLNKIYTFTYQVDNKSERYKVELIYVNIQGKNRFVFLDNGLLKQNKHLSDNFLDNRTRFIKEIEKWQKGGSYRKTHPIAYSNYEKLKLKRRELEDKIDEIDREIGSEERKILEDKIKEYQSDIDEDSLDGVKKELSSLINKCKLLLEKSKYSIIKRYYHGNPVLLLYDEVKHKYRFKVEFYSGQIYYEEIPESILIELVL